MPSRQPPRRSLSIRVDPGVVARLDRIVSELQKRFPTFRLSTSDAARLALEEGLVVLEEANVKPRGFGYLPPPEGGRQEKASPASPRRMSSRRKTTRRGES